jgi:hypothetical protein
VCFAIKFGNSIYFSGSGVRWIEIVGLERSSPSSNNSCLDGLHFGSIVMVNLSDVNITNCRASSYSCVSSVKPDNDGVVKVSLTGRYLNVLKNSGRCGFYRAADVGKSGWYLLFCNFYNNTNTIGVLGSYEESYGMTVNSCIFSGNDVDIGLINDGELEDNSNKFRLTN